MNIEEEVKEIEEVLCGLIDKLVVIIDHIEKIEHKLGMIKDKTNPRREVLNELRNLFKKRKELGYYGG